MVAISRAVARPLHVDKLGVALHARGTRELSSRLHTLPAGAGRKGPGLRGADVHPKTRKPAFTTVSTWLFFRGSAPPGSWCAERRREADGHSWRLSICWTGTACGFPVSGLGAPSPRRTVSPSGTLVAQRREPAKRSGALGVAWGASTCTLGICGACVRAQQGSRRSLARLRAERGTAGGHFTTSSPGRPSPPAQSLGRARQLRASSVIFVTEWQ